MNTEVSLTETVESFYQYSVDVGVNAGETVEAARRSARRNVRDAFGHDEDPRLLTDIMNNYEMANEGGSR